MVGKKFDQSVKTIIVGDSGVGKTCILTRFVNDIFETETSSTLGVEFMSKVVETKTHKIEIQLWDTAGQELFRAVTKAYYRGSIGAFIVFDITKRDTFINIERWYNDVKCTARSDVICFLVGNKSDMESQREVKKEEALDLAEKLGIKYFETSAKTGQNIEEMMHSCIESIEKLIDSGAYDGSFGNDQIDPAEEDKPTSTGCCK
ncbi:small GTP-binding protein [Histomonas meleagridis]|uniref:small GTP-binding protein n=1 Tax=Histomonas meleagridis TaxID=135588 RepID=UPI00355A9807|nr:small GTP-binding protein [Histomonas meleagridis]KAH0796486.1 small GTP-binding protein [Histomonas meleagridis]